MRHEDINGFLGLSDRNVIHIVGIYTIYRLTRYAWAYLFGHERRCPHDDCECSTGPRDKATNCKIGHQHIVEAENIDVSKS